MPLSPDPGARDRQLANLRRGPVSHGTGSARRLGPVRERHARALRADYPQLDDRRLSLLADLLARIDVAARWLDRRGSVMTQDGDVHPVVSDLDRWTSKAWQWLSELEGAQRSDPGQRFTSYMAELASRGAEQS